MGGESPVVELYDSDGNQLSVQDGVAIPANTPALMFAGSDGTNSRYITIDGSGHPVVVGAGTAGSPSGGVITIQGTSGGTAIPITGSVNIDAGNSSTTPLAGSGTFSGTGIDVSGYSVITVFAFADQSGTLNIEFSTNNTNWDDVTSYTVTASLAQSIQIGPQARYFRVVYQNGSSAQSVFRLQTIERSTTSFPDTIRISSTIDPNADAIVTKSVITGKTTGGGGGYVDVKVNPSGTLTVDASGSTVTVSGTVTSNQGTANTLSNGWPVKVTDGTNTATVTASSALKVDGSAVTQPVSGTVAVTQSTASNLNATVVGTGTDNTTNSTAKLPVLSARANTSAPSWTDGYMVPLSVDTSGNLRITGSISATNPSVSTTNSSPPASATYIGGSVTTAAPSYSNSTMNALSLTTAGALRVDGSATTQPVSGTVTATQTTASNLLAQVGGLAATGASPVGNPLYLSVTNPSGKITALAGGAEGSAGIATMGNEFVIHSNATVTSNGSITTAGTSYGTQQINLVVNIVNSPTGSNPTLQYTIQELDPGNNSTTFGNSTNTIVISSSGVYTTSLRSTTSCCLKISWTVTGSSPSFTGVYATIISKNTTLPINYGMAQGIANLASATQGPIYLTTYTEQSSNAQRSVKSSSVNDTSAGTGGRTLLITYYDSSVNGPFTETVTLNGTTAVATVNTNICYIESMKLLTVGSNGSNVGTISLYANNAGTGTVIGSISVNNFYSSAYPNPGGGTGDSQTRWAHHYVANGKVCYIHSVKFTLDSTYLCAYFMTSKSLNGSNNAELGIFDIAVPQNSWPGPAYNFTNPLVVQGPAKIKLYAEPINTAITVGGIFEYSES